MASSPGPGSVARSGLAQTPGGSVMGTPASGLGGYPSASAGGGAYPGAGLRGASSQPTPLTGRPELGYYVGFRPANVSAQRRSSMAPSVGRKGRKDGL